MDAEGRLVFDIFEGLCQSYLTDSETRLLKLRCGINTGYRPMSASDIATKFGLTKQKVRGAMGRALVKLPRSGLEQVAKYLENPEHRFHASLTSAERQALQKTIETALVLQSVRVRTTKRVSEVPKASIPSVKEAPSPPRTNLVEQLVAALDAIGYPSHYANVQAQVSQSGTTLQSANIYQIMTNSHEFVALGDGVFALSRWHNQLETADGTILRYCPKLPIKQGARSDTLFELFARTRDWIREAPLTYRETWMRTNHYTGAICDAQGLFELWYAFGICALVDYQQVKNYVVQSTLPEQVDIATLRRHALAAVIQRIDRMPNVLAAVANQRRPTTAQVSAHTYNDERNGADILARLRVLEALGAVRDEKGWQITTSGLDLLEQYPVDEFSPLVEPDSMTAAASTFEDFGMLDL